MPKVITEQEEAAHKKKKTRSPNYPTFGLEAAITKVDAVYQSEDRHWAPPDAIAAHLKLKATSSSFMTALSALKQFGLMDDQGVGGSRKLRVSDLAVDLIERGHETPEWKRCAKEAALRPRIHAELWERYSGNLPPKDDSIRIYLIRERADSTFNKAHVDSFIEQFRATIAYAGLTENDKIGDGVGESEPEVDDENSGQADLIMNPVLEIPRQKQTMLLPPETKREVFTLAEGDVMVQWPAHLSASSFQDLEDHLNLILRKVKRGISDGETN